MDTSDLYGVEQLSLFGDQLSLFGDQIPLGFGTLMEPDSPVNSPGGGHDSSHFDLPRSDRAPYKRKAVDSTTCVKDGMLPVLDGLEVGWLDRQHDMTDFQGAYLLEPVGSQLTEAHLSTNSQPLGTQNITKTVNDSNTEQSDTSSEDDLLSEVFQLLDNLSGDIDLDELISQDVSAPVTDPRLISPTSVSCQSDSGTESLASPCARSPVSASCVEATDESATSETATKKSKRGRRSAPYSKLPADRKERKKIQNKTAALKYRQKKREETKKVFTEVDILEARNKELKEKVESISHEIQYLNNLFTDLLKAKSTSH